MLSEGIYEVSFSSNVGSSGRGLIVVSNGAINGGDISHLYQGPYTCAGNTINATLSISQYNSSQQSVFGPLDNFILELSGAVTNGNSFKVAGKVAGQPQLSISINGNMLKPIVKG